MSQFLTMEEVKNIFLDGVAKSIGKSREQADRYVTYNVRKIKARMLKKDSLQPWEKGVTFEQ